MALKQTCKNHMRKINPQYKQFSHLFAAWNILYFLASTSNLTVIFWAVKSKSNHIITFKASVKHAQKSVAKFIANKPILRNSSRRNAFTANNMKRDISKKKFTNCITYLDCTNVAQYAYGLVAISWQLNALGLIDVLEIDLDSSLAEALDNGWYNYFTICWFCYS